MSWNGLSGVFLVHFLHVISAIFFVIKLVIFVVAYIVSNIALVLKVQETFFKSFLVRFGKSLLEFYLLLVGLLFLDQKGKQIRFQ